jgi:hypothetical protein
MVGASEVYYPGRSYVLSQVGCSCHELIASANLSYAAMHGLNLSFIESDT